ncbi:mas-related G-protein coupled receptor member H-like [Pituophis catenifer annectens]|uniref:mas-related G-protein coupled receptor member H-like n=1 Tax=Pituophis catenifer annectens TaxID=94852 RepID=UPI003990FCF9
MEHYENPLRNLSLENRNAIKEPNITTYFNVTQTKYIVLPVTFIICCIGLPLNGIVIWLLGFQMKRNPFTVLILNLAIADLGVLVFMPILSIQYFRVLQISIIPSFIIVCLSDILYINGLFLLTTISIDRCVSVFFPIWHHCSRPKYLSPAVCSLFWIISFLLGGIQNIMEYIDLSIIRSLHFVVIAMLCFPLITISTVILFIKIRMKPEQTKRGRLLVMILITLLCFLILTLPLYVYIVTAHFLGLGYIWDIFQFPLYFYVSSCLNSSVNPVIYFLVGRKKRAKSRENIKVIFQRIFREDDAPKTRRKFTKRVSNSL